jgi:hypothetical protein
MTKRLLTAVVCLTLLAGTLAPAALSGRPTGKAQGRVMEGGGGNIVVGGACWPPGSTGCTNEGVRVFCSCWWYGSVFRCMWIT